MFKNSGVICASRLSSLKQSGRDSNLVLRLKGMAEEDVLNKANLSTRTARVSRTPEGIVIVRILPGVRQTVADAQENIRAAVSLADGKCAIMTGMPGPSGYSFISYVKERSPETPVVVITGCGESDDPSAKLVSKWIRKPFRRKHVLPLVQELIG
jgi:CheY-like chemotaxis protein